MTNEERLSKLEKPFRDQFPIVVNGINVQVSYPELPKKETTSLSDRIAAMEKVHKEFSIIGGGNCNVSGSLKTGFCINSTCPGEEGTGPIPVGSPPITITGACCTDGTCSIATQSACEIGGGTWLGPMFDCDPNPCEGCNCAIDVTVTSTSTMNCSDGVEWDCGDLSTSTSYSRSFTAAEIQANFCTADDVVDRCCLDSCRDDDPNYYGQDAVAGPFVSFNCGAGTIRMTNQTQLNCIRCDTPCNTCDDCGGGISCLGTCSTPDHIIDISDAVGTFIFDDHIDPCDAGNCVADIHTEYTFS